MLRHFCFRLFLTAAMRKLIGHCLAVESWKE